MALGHWAVEYLGEGNGQGGSGGGGLVVHFVDDQMDKTWQEIYDALASGAPCIAVTERAEDEVVNQVYLTKAEWYDEGVYNVISADGMTTYVATSPSGYPQAGGT